MRSIMCHIGILLSFLVFIFLGGLFDVDSQAVVCDNKRSCEGNTITTQSDIDCFGYQSCVKTILNNNGSSSTTYCDGSFGCYKALSIASTNGASVYCYGLYSCAFVSDITSVSQLQCHAEKSCFASIITIGGALECYGSESCVDTLINVEGNNDIAIEFGGYGSGRNSVIYCNSGDCTLKFSGSESGHNTSIICGSDVASCTITIKCYTNACNNINSICGNGGNSNCAYSVECYGAERSDMCPNGYMVDQSDSEYQLPSLLNLTTLTTINNSNNICDFNNNDTNSIICDDYQECYASPSLSTINSNGSICCTADDSCHSSNEIKTHISLTGDLTNNYNDIAIRCDGAFSCPSVTNGIRATNGGSMYFSGDECGQTIPNITTTNEYDIFATGSQALYISNIYGGNNIYCLSHQTCYRLQVDNVNNIYAYGVNSHAGQTYNKCKMTNINENVYCAALTACANCIIENVTGNVYGSGRRALYSTTVNRVQKVFCFGETSCESCTMKNVARMIVSGDDAMSSATIYSETAFGTNEFSIKINGTMSTSHSNSLYCNITDTCSIYCESSDACLNLNVYCFMDDQCSIFRNDSGYNLPILLGNVSYVVFPSRLPTDNPTQEPSLSVYPTAIPSANPTYTPAETSAMTTSSTIDRTIINASASTTSIGWPNSSTVNYSSTAATTTATTKDGINDVSETENNKDDSDAILVIMVIILLVIIFMLIFGMVLAYGIYKKRQAKNDINQNGAMQMVMDKNGFIKDDINMDNLNKRTCETHGQFNEVEDLNDIDNNDMIKQESNYLPEGVLPPGHQGETFSGNNNDV